jgi:RimJ/RimL family protein N-acetyltransferase
MKRPEARYFDGKWVKLEVLNPKNHASDLYEMATSSVNDEHNIFTFMMFGPFDSKDEFDSWLEKQALSADRIVFAVFSKRLNKYVGMYSIINIDEHSGRAEFGSIWYGTCAQRTEINTETTYLLLCYLFEELKYKRIEWKCDNENTPSKNAALRLGFEYEGLFRKHMIVKTKNRDTSWFSMIDDEWISKKRVFDDYLLKKYEQITPTEFYHKWLGVLDKDSGDYIQNIENKNK